MKFTIHTDGFDAYMERGLERAKKMDRGERVEPSFGVTFESPAQMFELLTAERVRVVDWENSANNDFLLARHFSLTGTLYICRPDSVGFVTPDRSGLVVALVTQVKKRGWYRPTSLSCLAPPGTAAGEDRPDA